MLSFLTYFSGVSAVVGALYFLVGMNYATSAPQEAALAGCAIALAVIPYVFMRCFQMTAERTASAENAAALLQAVRSLRSQAGGERGQSREEPVVAAVGIGSGSPAPQMPPRY